MPYSSLRRATAIVFGVAVLASSQPAAAVWVNAATGEPIRTTPYSGSSELSFDPNRAHQDDAEYEGEQLHWDHSCSTWRTRSGREVHVIPSESQLVNEDGNADLIDKDYALIDRAQAYWVPCRKDGSYKVVEGTPEEWQQRLKRYAGGYEHRNPDYPALYAKVMAGGAAAGSATFDDGSEPLNLGGSFGAAIGLSIPQIPNVSAEVDILRTSRQFSGNADASLSTTSIMVDGLYSFHPSPAFTIFTGLGVGAVNISEDYPGGGSGWGPGYEAVLGTSLPVADHISAFAEVAGQNTFGAVNASNGFPVQAGSVRVTGGFMFNLFDIKSSLGY